MKLTGERPMEGSTPDSLLALHDAGYREIAARLGPGVVLDVGCGVGAQTAKLAGPGRFVIGVDYHAPTAVGAGATYGPEGLRFAAMDGSRLGIADATVDYISSSHIIEHFVQPERHVAELARVTRDSGSAFIITPNAPADFENPFHVYLFDPAQLRSLVGLFFADVEILGIEGDEALHADFATRRSSGDRLLQLDRLNLRHKLPRGAYVWAYEHLLPMVYNRLGRERTGIGSGIDESHLFATSTITESTPALMAIGRSPRRRVG